MYKQRNRSDPFLNYITKASARRWAQRKVNCAVPGHWLGGHCVNTHTAHAYTSHHMRIQYIPRNMHTVFALLCFVVVIHWLFFYPYPSGLLHWHCGNLTIAPVPAKQPWWIWINTSCEFIMNDCITTTKQSTTKLCAYFLGYTVHNQSMMSLWCARIQAGYTMASACRIAHKRWSCTVKDLEDSENANT